jgi:AcrR family transcriptional regulator
MATVLHAFATTGYDGVSLRTLNAELGVSHNLLYSRFGSKDQLWRAAVDWGFGAVVDAVEAADDPAKDPVDRLCAIIRAFVVINGERPDLLRLVNIEGSQETERLAYLYKTVMDRISSRYRAVVDDLVAAGRMRPVPWRSFFFVITAGGSAMFSSEALARRVAPGDPRSAEQIQAHADFLANLVVTGLSLPARSDAAAPAQPDR